MDTKLAKYDAAKHALAEAKAVDEVKNIHDVAAAMKAYARQSEDKQLEIDASEIRIRAERRLGELIREQKETVGLQSGARGKAGPGRGKNGVTQEDSVLDDRPTLADAGISKKLSSRSQAIAGIPEEEFEQTLGEHREQQQAVTASTMEKLSKKAHVAQNTGENEWYTPKEHIESARKVMGSIDLDPASCEIANNRVRAAKIYTKEDSGLTGEWSGNVWMNPPYAQPLIQLFSDRVSEQFRLGKIGQAIVLVNNATETKWFQTMAEHSSAACFPKSRIRFLDPEGNPGAPLQGQAILYFGKNAVEFAEEFSKYGKCYHEG